MNIIICMLAIAAVPIIIGVIAYNVEKRNDEEIDLNSDNEHVFIKIPKVYILIGSIGSSPFLALLVGSHCFPNVIVGRNIFTDIVFGFFLLLGAYLAVATMVWRIEIFRHEAYFILRTSFFRTHKIQYCDCIGYKLATDSLVLKTNSRTFRIDDNATNFKLLIKMLNLNQVKKIR